MLYSVPPYKGK